jgi:hypothetical protein
MNQLTKGGSLEELGLDLGNKHKGTMYKSRVDSLFKEDMFYLEMYYGCNRRHDTQHNDIQHNDTQHNDTQHNIKVIVNTLWLNVIYAECRK